MCNGRNDAGAEAGARRRWRGGGWVPRTRRYWPLMALGVWAGLAAIALTGRPAGAGLPGEFMAGDVNCDERIDLDDLFTLVAILFGNEVPCSNPDVNGDQLISVADVVKLRQLLAALPTATVTPELTGTSPPSVTATSLGDNTPTSTGTATETRTPTLSPSITPTASQSPTGTLPTAAPTATATPTGTATRTRPPTRTLSPSRTRTSTRTPTRTFTASRTRTPTTSRTPTRTASISPTASITLTPTVTLTPSITPTLGPTEPPTVAPTPTVTVTVPPSRTPTKTKSVAPTRTPTMTGTATRTRTETRTATLPPSRTATRTVTQTRTASNTRTATQTGTPTPTRTRTRTPTPTSPRPIGPEITFFGVASADNHVKTADDVTEDGVLVYSRPIGHNFIIFVEGRPGTSNAALGNCGVWDDKLGVAIPCSDPRPDLQIQADRPLGNGSAVVCDRTEPGIGGVPGIDPPNFGPGQAITDALWDFACRFDDHQSTESACTFDEHENPRFVRDRRGDPVRTTRQFCTAPAVGAELDFPSGDTRLTVQLRDVRGNIGNQASIVIRVP